MIGTVLAIVFFAAGLACVSYHVSRLRWQLLLITLGLFGFTVASVWPWFVSFLFWGLWLTILSLAWIGPLRRLLITGPVFRRLQKQLPRISATEQEALEAGDPFWESELLSGDPQWEKLFSMPLMRLNAEEQSFLDHQVNELCERIHPWEMHTHGQFPEDVWEWAKKEKFLGMIIPKEYGGLGFSALAHSNAIARIASRCVSAAVSIMVPNSLGPAELLIHYGTTEQKNHYLPRLAQGIDVPCFALTGLEAGSDAASIVDIGIIGYGTHEGQSVLGAYLTWNKRYITLAPIATLLGLAVRLHDPEHLLGPQEDRGITLFLIPTNHPGVRIGKRHAPMNLAFMNGPTEGDSVFVPLDYVIGGTEKIGQGWRMLMECLMVGRSISLPALASALSAMSHRTLGAYAALRKQFRTPIGHLEGVQEALSRIAGLGYLVQAARLLTAQAVDLGIKPAVASAITKYHTTEYARTIVNTSMDVLAGRGIQMGPRNFMAEAYTALPISITVEGANILTRNLIIFGQGMIRCHPLIQQELHWLKQSDGMVPFDKLFQSHLKHVWTLYGRCVWGALTRGYLIKTPSKPYLIRHCQKLSLLSAQLAFLTEVALMTLGSSLKKRERLSARLGDVLSHLYLGSAALKQFNDLTDLNEHEAAHLNWAIRHCSLQAKHAMLDFLHNLPSRKMAWVVRVLLFPLGVGLERTRDRLDAELAQMMQRPSPTRQRLSDLCFVSRDPSDPIHRLDAALEAQWALEPIEQQFQQWLQQEGVKKPTHLIDCWTLAEEKGILTTEQISHWKRAEALRVEVLHVDSF